jgi:hypothetical protein
MPFSGIAQTMTSASNEPLRIPGLKPQLGDILPGTTRKPQKSDLNNYDSHTALYNCISHVLARRAYVIGLCCLELATG